MAAVRLPDKASRTRTRSVQKIIIYHQAVGAFVATLRRLAM
jgi:hypothetical protein